MRGSRSAWAVALVMLAAFGCSGRTIIVAVDPFPRMEGGIPDSAPSGLLDDLIGFWRLNDPTGSAAARDWSGWGNDGTLVGLDPAIAWETGGGPEGAALSTHTDGHINVPASKSIDSITNEVTVAAWMYVDGTLSEHATAISRQFGGAFGQHYHLSFTDGYHASLIITPGVDTNQKVIYSSVSVFPQTWTHLAGTYDGMQMRLYVNGAEVGSLAQTGAFAAETNPVVLSGNGNGSARTVSEEVPGQLADIMLYRRALSADEILRIFQGALLGPRTATEDGGGN